VSASDLAKFALFAALDREASARLADAMEVEDVAAGVCLFREGDAPDGAIFITRGRVRIHREEIRGDTEFGPGDALGALSLVVEGPRMTSAETLSRTGLLRLRVDAYRRFASEDPAAACRVLEALVCEAAQAMRDHVRIPPVDRTDASD